LKNATTHGSSFTSIILTQAINHSTEHRAHIMTIITQQGIEPPEVDGWAYVVANIPTEE